MSAAYGIAGVLVGVMSANTSAAEPAWAWLLAPAALLILVGTIMETNR